MDYTEHLGNADGTISHLQSLSLAADDPAAHSLYVGFLAVTAVTAFEAAIKEVLFSFSGKKHKVLETFARSQFEKFNGRIKVSDLRDRCTKPFGGRYDERFCESLAKAERQALRDYGKDPKTSYGNLIIWRNSFAHGGVPPTVTFEEAAADYQLGKTVVHCFASAMKR